jgi:hypothetical protein
MMVGREMLQSGGRFPRDSQATQQRASYRLQIQATAALYDDGGGADAAAGA